MIPQFKVKKQKNPFYKKNFEVVNDLDAAHKLIPSSKFVISIGASTAIGIASATNKPILLIYNNQIKDFNPGLFEEIKFTSKIYRTSLININNFKTKNLIKPVNKQYNEKLKYKYMTSEEIKKYPEFSNTQ